MCKSGAVVTLSVKSRLAMHAGRAKGMMAERLAASEAKLLKMSRDDVVQTLVETKMTLAQSEFQTLQLQFFIWLRQSVAIAICTIICCCGCCDYLLCSCRA